MKEKQTNYIKPLEGQMKIIELQENIKEFQEYNAYCVKHNLEPGHFKSLEKFMIRRKKAISQPTAV